MSKEDAKMMLALLPEKSFDSHARATIVAELKRILEETD
jgi:hypothetical protein